MKGSSYFSKNSVSKGSERDLNGELVYIHDRRKLDYSDPFKCFPFINPTVDKAGYIIIEDTFHDTMFPYSELKYTLQESVGLSVEQMG